MTKSKSKTWLGSLTSQIKNVTTEQLAAIEPKEAPCSRCQVLGEIPLELRALYFIHYQHFLRIKELSREPNVLSSDIHSEGNDELRHHREELDILDKILQHSLFQKFPALREHGRYSLKKGWVITYHEESDMEELIDFLAGIGSLFLHTLRRRPEPSSH